MTGLAAHAQEVAERVLKAEDISASKCYYIYTTGRGGLTITSEAATNLVGTRESGVNQTVDATNPLQQFAFINYEGNFYLYSVGAGKFVNVGNKGTLNAMPADPIYFKNADAATVMLYFDADHNINLGGSNQVIIDDWSSKDAGNSFNILVAADFDTEAIVAEMAARAEQAERDARFAELLGQAHEALRDSVAYITTSEGLIYDPSQLSSPMTSTAEGSIEALIDNDPETYWHSDYSTKTEAHTHYVQVDLGYPMEGQLLLTMTRRSGALNDHCVLMGIETSTDGQEFTPAGQLDLPFEEAGETIQRPFTLEQPASSFRFYNDMSNGAVTRGYWHMAELQLNTCTLNPSCPMALAPEAVRTLAAIYNAALTNGTPSADDVTTLENAIAAYKETLAGSTPTTLPEGYTPAAVQDLAGSWQSEDGHDNVLLTFVAPTQMFDSQYNSLPLSAPITKIVISRSEYNMGDYQEIHTIEAPEATAGAELSFTDHNVARGNYDYMVNVYVGEVCDWGSSINVIVGELPAAPTEEEFTASVDGYKVTLTIVAPTTNSLGETLNTPLTKMEIGEFGPMSFEPDVLKTIDNPVAGQTYTHVLESVTDGSHTYTVRFYTEVGAGDMGIADTFVGLDQPGYVENITVTPTEGGYVITWDAPTVGLNNGDMGSPDDLTYTVKRGANEYDLAAVTIAEGIKERTVTDNTVFSEETRFCYFITATNKAGEGYAASSEEQLAGPAAILPYTESFDANPDQYGNTTFEHSSWAHTTSGFFCAWTIGQDCYINEKSVQPYNGASLLYAYYDNFMTTNQSDELTSGRIDFSSTKTATLTFWYYDAPLQDGTTTLNVNVSTDGETFTNVFTHAMGSTETEGWQQATISLAGLVGATSGKVQFQGMTNGTSNMPIAIDEILIAGDTNSIIATGLTTTGSADAYDLQGRRVNKAVRGLYIQNGTKVLR